MAETATGTAPVRILLVNIISLNVGDAAILEAQIDALRDAYDGRVEIAVADEEHEAAAELYPHIRFVPALHLRRVPRRERIRGRAKLARSLRRRRVSAAVRLLPHSPALARRLLGPTELAHLERLRRADVVVSTGGTYFVDRYPVRSRVDELLAAQALGRPTYLYTQSFGPLHDRRKRRLMRRALRDIDGVFLRDERSRRHVLELGVPEERVQVRPDAAFGFARPSAGTPPANDGPLRVAISVRHWPHFRTRSPEAGGEAYRRAVAGAVRRLHALGAETTFVSTCQGVPAYWTDDSRFARSLVDELLAEVPGVRVDSAFRRPRELVEHLRDFDIAIATRLHFAILALDAGVPVVPIAYAFKTAELFDGLGMSELVVDIETITADALTRAIDAALASRAALHARIRELLPGLRRRAAAPADHIRRRHPPRASDRGRIAARTTKAR